MSYANFEQRGTTALVTLDRPERLNAISDPLLADLQAAIDAAEAVDDVRAVVLCGAGRAFCAGEDLKEFEHTGQSVASARRHVEAIQSITRSMLHSSKVFVVAVHGYAVGGGFEWMLNGDVVVAADDLVAYFPEMDWAQFPTGGVTWLLPMATGYQRAMELILLGERQSADRLLELGLVNWVVPRDQLLDKAMQVADRIADKSAFSIARLKKHLHQDLRLLDRALDLEQRATI